MMLSEFVGTPDDEGHGVLEGDVGMLLFVCFPATYVTVVIDLLTVVRDIDEGCVPVAVEVEKLADDKVVIEYGVIVVGN